MKKEEIATYITQQQKKASAFETRAWELLAMWNNTRDQETFIEMALAHWLDAKQELAKHPDEFYESHVRDEKVCGSILTYMGVDLASAVPGKE